MVHLNGKLHSLHEVAVSANPNRFKKVWDRDKYLILMSIFPAIIIIVFSYFPIYGLVMAFERYSPAKGYWESEWVGLYYFKQFFQDPYCWRIIKNTVLLGFYSLLWGFPAPIILALLLNEVKSSKYKRTVQTITYLPHFISAVIVVGIMKEMLSPVDGIIGKFMSQFGMQTINFFSEPDWFRTMYIGSNMWQSIGFSAIIYLAALAGIDTEQYEAAVIDGANRWHKIWYITIPGIMPTIIILLIMSMGGIFSNDFQKILLMYSPATYSTADVISTYTYRYGIENANYSYASAVGLMLSIISIVFVTGANFISKKTTESALW